MPRRTYRKRRPTTRRYKKKGKLTMSKVLSTKRQMNVHHYKFTTLYKNALEIEFDGNDQNFAMAFQLTDIVNHAELTALYDSYRINGVLWKIQPRQTTIDYQTAPGVAGTPATLNTDFGGTNLFGASNFGFPEICTALDFDDDTNPSSLGEILQYSSCKITPGNRAQSRYLRPRIKVDSSNTGLSLNKQWLDCDNSGVEHYGIKGVIANVPTVNISGTSNKPVMWFDYIVVYYLSFRSTR